MLAKNDTTIDVLGRIPMSDAITESDLDDILNSTPRSAYFAYGVLGFGGFVFLLGFCGCCGAIRESKCLLTVVRSSLYLHFERW